MARDGTVLRSRRVAGLSSSHKLSMCFVHIFVTALLLGLPCAHSDSKTMYVDDTNLEILVGNTKLINR